MVLKGADGVVFVADRSRSRHRGQPRARSRTSGEPGGERDTSLEQIPTVIQYNKRDLSDLTPIETMRAILNPRGAPEFEAAAVEGRGVFETLKGLSRLVLSQMRASG